MVNSCGECANCRNGDEQYCVEGMVGTYAGTDRDGTTTQGGYSTHVVVDADFVLSVPEGLDPAAAAPLLCAGITTYSPLRHWGAGPGTQVAVVGLGGLGHMAVKIAHAMGAEVTVLSQSLKKQEDGLRLGADHYFATSRPRHVRGTWPVASTSSSTPSAPRSTSTPTSACSPSTAPSSTSAPRPSR